MLSCRFLVAALEDPSPLTLVCRGGWALVCFGPVSTGAWFEGGPIGVIACGWPTGRVLPPVAGGKLGRGAGPMGTYAYGMARSNY